MRILAACADFPSFSAPDAAFLCLCLYAERKILQQETFGEISDYNAYKAELAEQQQQQQQQ